MNRVRHVEFERQTGRGDTRGEFFKSAGGAREKRIIVKSEIRRAVDTVEIEYSCGCIVARPACKIAGTPTSSATSITACAESRDQNSNAPSA